MLATLLAFMAMGVSDPGAPADPVAAVLNASFISTGRKIETEAGRSIVFRKVINLNVAPKLATLNLFANSRYVVWINGKYLERGPARFEATAPEYDSIPIATSLHKGANAIAILVTGPLSNGKIQWRPLGLTANVQIDQATFNTDPTWRWSDHTRYQTVVADWPNVYDQADATEEDGDWTQADYSDANWTAAVPIAHQPRFTAKLEANGQSVSRTIPTPWWGSLTARRAPRLAETVVTPTWSATFGKILNAGESITFKFNRLVLAYSCLDFDANAGSEIEFLHSPNTTYRCREGRQQFMTSDTQALFEGGFRVKSGQVRFHGITFVERLYPFDVVGTFESSDSLLNKLWTTCVRGLQVASEDSYIDCADRERVEWMDCDPPAFDVTRVAMVGPGNQYGDPRLLESLLRRTAYSIQPGGWVKAHTSSDRFDIHAKMEDRACDWIEGARRYYDSSGKTEVIREIWPMIVSQLDYFLARKTERGLIRAREWVVWGNPVGYQTCEGTALNSFVYKVLSDAAFLGHAIGKDQDAMRFAKEAKDLKSKINALLWDEKQGVYYAGYYDLAIAKRASDYRPLPVAVVNNLIAPTYTAQLFALDQDVVPSDRRARVRQYVLAHPPKSDDIMQYYYHFKQQYIADQPEEDFAVLQTLRHQWKGMADSPYQAGYEGLHASGSLAHCYGIFPAYFLSAYVLGVQAEGTPTTRQAVIQPRLADLSAAAGTVVTELGPVSVSYQKKGVGWTFKAFLPSRLSGHLKLPATQAVVDGKKLSNVKSNSRWVMIPIGPGSHSGSWQ